MSIPQKKDHVGLNPAADESSKIPLKKAEGGATRKPGRCSRKEEGPKVLLARSDCSCLGGRSLRDFSNSIFR